MTGDPYRYFRTEARDLIDGLMHGVLELEKGRGDSELVSRLLRAAHTLKGAARVVRQARMADTSHVIEEVLGELRDAPGRASADRIKVLLGGVDSLSADLAALTGPAPRGTEPPPGERGTPPAEATEERLEAIRVEVKDIDRLLRTVSELRAILAGLQKQVDEVQRLAKSADRLRHEGKTRRVELPASAAGRTEELEESLRAASRDLSAIADRSGHRIRDLAEQAAAMRLVPAASLFSLLERTVRDAALAGGKDATFAGSGGDVRLDARALSVLRHAFVQIVRNAVAHGIEPPEGRRAEGKPATGRVHVRVQRRSDRAVFSCSDDGRGIDVEKVRQVVVSRGLASGEQAAKMTPAQTTALLLRGGLTTAAGVSQLSGRGIGLDVVREAVASLNGTIDAWSQPGVGTRIEVSVPVHVESQHVVDVRAGASDFAIPLHGVKRTLRVTASEVAASPDGESILDDGRSVRFVSLARLVSPEPERRGLAFSALVIEGGGSVAAIGVDRVLGTSRVVVRSMPPVLGPTPMLAGAFVDGEGDVRVVLSVEGLLRAVENQAYGPVPAGAGRMTVPLLVIDDSLTTRMLEQGILEAAGYEVDTAASGDEALEKARRRRYGVFIVDVEMPGMDGFTFIRTAGRERDLQDVPSIVLTSRDSPEDRARGAQAGAKAYIVKSAFDEKTLLRTIRELIG